MVCMYVHVHVYVMCVGVWSLCKSCLCLFMHVVMCVHVYTVLCDILVWCGVSLCVSVCGVCGVCACVYTFVTTLLGLTLQWFWNLAGSPADGSQVT